MNGRSFYTPKELDAADISSGNWFGLYRIQTAGGTREILARKRKSSTLFACKVLPLIVSKKQANAFGPRGKCSLKRFRKALKEHKSLNDARVPLLACDRPSTYFPGLSFRKNWIYELAGGVVDPDEKVSVAGVREMLEELGLKAKQVVAYARLSKPRLWDSGSHAEYVSTVVALCYGDIAPKAREGIVPEKCQVVPFASLDRFVRRADRKRIAVEGHILSAAALLVKKT